MNIINKVLTTLCALFLLSLIPANAITNTQTDVLTFSLSSFTRIEPITSPVLTANITNGTGNLLCPLQTTFKVITNSREDKLLYLKAKAVTADGYEDAMFAQGGQVYVAFTNLAKQPTSNALQNCKISSVPSDSPGVVAYPLISVTGAKEKHFNYNKYELTVGSGESKITAIVGSNVLKSSFAANDPRGFYQAVLSLTEADI